jgi:hypothetical protein
METRIGMKEIKIIRRRMQENIEMNISTSRKMNQRPKDPRKQGWGAYAPTLVFGLFQVFRDLLNTVKEHGSMTVIVDGRDGLDGNIRSVFSDKMEHMEKKTPGGMPYSQSSNPVVARSSRAGAP